MLPGPIRSVCVPFVGDSVGGSHLSASLLIEHLDRAQYKPQVVVHRRGPLTAHFDHAGIEWKLLPLTNLAGQSPNVTNIALAQALALPKLIRFLRDGKFDAVHTNDLRMHLTWAPAARVAGCRFIWHQRVLLSPSPLWSLLTMAAHHIICISRAVQETLPKHLYAPASVISNPVSLHAPDRNQARRKLLAELSLAPSTRIIGFVGNMTNQKRPHVFVKAAARLAAAPISGASCTFLLFGDNRGGEMSRVSKLAAELGIASRIKFMGFRFPIEPWIAGLDVLLAPGVDDGFGRTLAEAMIVGTPIVAATSGGHAEIVENDRNGLLVPPDDADAIAMATLRLLDDEALRSRLAEAAKIYAVATFSPSEHAARVAEVYDHVFAHGANGPRTLSNSR